MALNRSQCDGEEGPGLYGTDPISCTPSTTGAHNAHHVVPASVHAASGPPSSAPFSLHPYARASPRPGPRAFGIEMLHAGHFTPSGVSAGRCRRSARTPVVNMPACVPQPTPSGRVGRSPVSAAAAPTEVRSTRFVLGQGLLPWVCALPDDCGMVVAYN